MALLHFSVFLVNTDLELLYLKRKIIKTENRTVGLFDKLFTIMKKVYM